MQLRKYSKGMIQRVGVAQALINDPEVVFLDEPMSGLDPMGRRHVRDIILRLRDRGATVFFSSHQLGDVERLADHIAVLAKGRLVAMMSERELAERLADGGVMRVRLRARVIGLLDRLQTVSPQALWHGDELIVPGPSTARPAVLDLIRAAGGEITGLTAAEGRLDEFYRALVEAHP
jgi:ABC-type multidrug transport system ATPase subunit